LCCCCDGSYLSDLSDLSDQDLQGAYKTAFKEMAMVLEDSGWKLRINGQEDAEAQIPNMIDGEGTS
jgi:hypothetical protein